MNQRNFWGQRCLRLSMRRRKALEHFPLKRKCSSMEINLMKNNERITLDVLIDHIYDNPLIPDLAPRL